MKAFIAALALMLATTAFAAQDKNPRVALETDNGTIIVELYPDKAPITVKNFLDYVDSGHYSDTVFHRVIKDFMIQGGGLTDEMTPKATKPAIKNEADNGLKNDKYFLAMARTNAVDSATSQFFINTKNNDFLNYKSPDPRGYGYAVFGKVVDGMEVVDSIEAAKTGSVKGFKDAPLKPIHIKKIERK